MTNGIVISHYLLSVMWAHWSNIPNCFLPIHSLKPNSVASNGAVEDSPLEVSRLAVSSAAAPSVVYRVAAFTIE